MVLKFSILLLSVVTCLGQSGISSQPFLTGFPQPDLFAGLTITNRWISSSLPTNTLVSDWIAVTNSFHWIQVTGGNQPSNATVALGVRFDSGKYLNTTNVFSDGNLVTLIIYSFDGTLSPVGKGFIATPSAGVVVTGITTFGGGPFTWHVSSGNF